MRGRLSPATGATMLALLAGEAFACTAAATIQQAKDNQGSKSYENARIVAAEELDREGIEPERLGVWSDGYGGTVTATPLEAAVGTLFIEKFNGQFGVWNEAKNGAIETKDWRAMLTNVSTDHGLATVREHVLMHAREFAVTPNAPSVSSEPQEPAPSEPAPGGVEGPAPSAPAPSEVEVREWAHRAG